MGVQVTKSCEERTLYVWPGWPVPLKVMGAPAEAQIWSVGGITEKGWMRYRRIGRLVPAGSVKGKGDGAAVVGSHGANHCPDLEILGSEDVIRLTSLACSA